MPTFEELKPMLRPTGVHSGVMKADEGKCVSCGLCIKNCPFRCLEMDADNHPKMKDGSICISCANCIVTCPTEAISFVQYYYQEKGGFFETDIPAYKFPLEPKDAEGNPTQWTEAERLILERRSVRNFKNKPVPNHLIRRVLEAGRFAPSGGNHQPWKFTVVTDPVFISQLEVAVQAVWAGMYSSFTNDEAVMNLVNIIPTGVFDSRTQYGVRCIAKKELQVYCGAPVVIFLGLHERLNGPDMHAGICGQNMTLAASALGLGSFFSNFGAGANFIPEIKAKLGFEDPSWTIKTTLCLGYPGFKQTGVVARQLRPVTWFRPGSDGQPIEE